MKKIASLLTVFLLSIILVSCSDAKHTDNSINVLFFTGQSGSNVPASHNLAPNSKITEPEEPVRSGFRFDGWFKDVNYTDEWDFVVDTVGETSLVLYAKWGPGFFSINYELNGGTMPSTFKPLEDYPEDQRDPETNPLLLQHLFYTVGRNNVLPRPTRTGYVFKNFYLYDEFQWVGAPENTDQSWKPGDNGYNSVPSQLAQDLVLYAHWDPIKLSIIFNTNYPVSAVMTDGYYRSRTLVYGYDFVYDSNYDGLPGVNRLPDFKDFSSGGQSYETLQYEFLGWNTRADGTGTWFGDGTGTPGESTSLSVEFLSRLYAQWKPKNA